MFMLSKASGFGRRRVTASGYSCTITAGNFSSAIFGYAHATSAFGAFGSRDTEPVAGQTLLYAYSDNTGTFVAAFVGNLSATLAGLHVWWDGVDYGVGESSYQWAYDEGTNSTVWAITSGGPTIANGSVKLLEIK